MKTEEETLKIDNGLAVTDKDKSSVLIFCDWYEPGFKAGGPIQSCRNIVNSLHKDYIFHIVTSDRDLGDNQPYQGIQMDKWISKENEINIWYASPGTMHRNLIKKLIQKVDPHTIYFNSMFSKHYTMLPLLVLRSGNLLDKAVLAPRGMLHAGAMQQKTLKKRLFLQLFKWIGISRKITFHATDIQEELDIRGYFPGSEIKVAENIPNEDKLPWQPSEKKAGDLRMVFVSRIHPKKNLHYLLNLMERLNPAAKVLLDVYGEPDDPIYTDKCRELAAKLPENCVVSFRGPLRHKDVFPTLRKYHLFLLPTLGENFGHAIFEALSSGRPVLISDQTPWRSLKQHRAGFDIPLDNPDGYRKCIDQFLAMDEREFNEWSMGARAFAGKFTATFDYSLKYHMLFK